MWKTQQVCKSTPFGTAYRVSGNTAGPVIVLIHGVGLSQAVFDDIVPVLGQQNLVVTYDLFGHGKSAQSQLPVTLTTLSDQIVELLDHLNIVRASLIGFSIGGMINRRFALDHSDRLDRLVILNSPHERTKLAQTQIEERTAQVLVEGPMATLDVAIQRWFTPRYLASGASGPARVRQWRAQVDADSYAGVYEVLAKGVTELIHPSPAITSPCLVLTCAQDSGSTPEMTHAIASEIDGSVIVILPNLKHLGLMEDPVVFTDSILEFLNTT
jgi:pimeloyl-ACP methyl ester carboxylesterase